MGSARSPSTSTLDQHPSPYTHPHHKRKSDSSRDYPEDSLESPGSPVLHRKKKKKSKKERHQYDYDDHDDNDNHSISYSNGHGARALSPQPQPLQKLPKIKISLRLPSNPAIIPTTTTSTSSSSTHHRRTSSSGSSRKKRRSSEHISVVSEDDDGDNDDQHELDHRLQYPLQEPERSAEDQDVRSSSTHKKKKKHKHKHKHRHHRHEEGEDEEPAYNAQETYEDERRHYDAHEMEAAKVRLSLGNLDKEMKKSRKSSVSQRTHHSHPSDAMEEPAQQVVQRQSSSSQKARSRSRSTSQIAVSSPILIKQEEAPHSSYHESNGEHMPVGQKRPFSSLISERSESQDTEGMEQMTDIMDEDDFDDPLAGELDEPEDDDEEDDDDDEEDDQQNGARNQSEEEELMSPTPDASMRAQFGSKSVKGGQKGSKAIPSSRTPTPATGQKSQASMAQATREGSVSNPTAVTTKTARKGKTARRLMSPKTATSAVPKKKELAVVCHKLLDNFIRKDSYVLFTEPVDPQLVPDYATVIKNPMDFSTMRAKVERNFYPNIDEFLKDFQLVCDNARLYNSKETLYWKQADKLWEWGSKAIERDRKTVLDKDEEVLRTVKDEETVDVGGMGDYNNNSNSSNNNLNNSAIQQTRGSFLSMDNTVDSPMSLTDAGRSHTPQQYRKARKIKYRRDGTIAFTYSTDGTIDPASHPDPWSLIPVAGDFGSAPLVCPLVETNTQYSGQYLDDYPYWKVPKSVFRPAAYLDYGPYAILGRPAPETGNASGVQNIPAYTGMVFGDEKGEAYVRSLAMFLDGIVDQSELASMNKEDAAGLREVQEYVRHKVETLTRGASTIVDKVTAVVKEEKAGLSLDIDTRVPINLWRQKFDVQDESVSSIKPDEAKDMEMADSTHPSKEEIKVEAKAELKDEDAEDGKMASIPDMGDSLAKQKEAKPEWIDIRQVVQDIRAWPKVLRERTDYQTWRLLKIELDSILPPPQPSNAAALPVSASEDEFEVKWGQRWAVDNAEEAKKWVREHLEHNSAEMRQVVQLLALKTVAQKGSAASTLIYAAPAASSGSTAISPTVAQSPTTSTAGLIEQEKVLVERLIKSIRKRLADMAQYIPLSEINPQRLPPPQLPTPAPATTVAPPAPTTASSTLPSATVSTATATPVSASSTVAPSGPSPQIAPVTRRASAAAAASVRTSESAPIFATVPAPSTPSASGEGSVSSLSSPGSSSP